MSLFREGGEHKIRKVGHEQYSMSIQLPPDLDGRTARACPSSDCSPAFFKLRNGTGLSGQASAFCPYCRHEAAPNDFATKRQRAYVQEVVKREAAMAAERMIRETLGMGHSGRRRLADGLMTLDLEIKPAHHPRVWRPMEEVLKRDLVCPHCTLDHSVFGFAVWCPDCGKDIFISHVRGEIAVVETILGDVDRREKDLGPRVAAHDIGNALEDYVSIFEATLKIQLRRHLAALGTSEEKVEEIFRKIGSRMQSVKQAQEIIATYCGGIMLFEASDDALARLTLLFEKRHPITHNLGVVDRKYLERVQESENEGKDIYLTKEEVLSAGPLMLAMFERLHGRLFPEAKEAKPDSSPPSAT